ncbi:MAG: AAA family ATPase, partial [Oscillospiraceae bacterium]
MLSLLHIENIAVIESADIAFDGGFNALTGETGAGKSIVVDAIGAVIGERTSRDLIRTGAKSARVEAVFNNVRPLPWFAENGFEPDENGELLLRREIQADGKNICRVGGQLLTVSQLKTLGAQLINIHGQHDGQQLLDERCHLSYLDRFGDLEDTVAEFRSAFSAMNTLRREIASLQMDEAEKSRKMDSLSFQIAELERAELKEGEEETLTARRSILRNSGKLTEAVTAAHDALSGDDDREGALALMMEGEHALLSGGKLSEELSALAVKLTELRYATGDIAEQIRDLRASFDFEPGELDELETRLDTLYRLKKKYGDSEGEMLCYLEKCRAELDDIEYSADKIAQLEKKLAKALEDATCKGKLLTEKRQVAAGKLEAKIRAELADLDMPKVQFVAEFS